MKAFKRLFIFYTTLILISVILHSCCGNNDYKIDGKGTISAVTYDLQVNPVDTLQGPTKIDIYYEYNKVASLSELSLIQDSYATSCDPNFKNDLDESSLKISFDKPFTYNGNTVAANTNFIDSTGLSTTLYHEDAWLRVILEQAFIDNTSFEPDTYTLKVELKTDDDVDLTSEISFEAGY